MSSDIVQRLREHLDQNPKVRADFEKSLKEALAYNVPEFEEWGIETLDDYLNYYESFLKWVPTENKDGKYVLKHICIFYFVLDLFPMAKHQGEISPITTPPYTFLSQWIIDYAKAMGTFMDSPESISEESIDTFYQAESYHMWDYERVPWRTFNEFFARKIKPEVRPIDSPNDNKIIVSAADAKFDGAWPVNGNSLVHLKGMPWSIRQLLDDAKGSYQSTFAGGVFCHSFLGPNDYHRQHAPVSGEVLEARVIEGLCYLEVEPKHDNNLVDGHRHLHMHRRMEDVVYTDSESGALQGAAGVANNPGYQFIQARGLILIQTADIGLVAVLPIGMAQVSSVVLSVKKGDRVKKGDELAYFQLGGSDVVMVFEEQANVKFTANHHDEQHGRHGWYPFGRQIAVASPST